MNVNKYMYYMESDEWSIKDFIHKRNANSKQNIKINFSSVPSNFKVLTKQYIYSALNQNTFLTCKAKLNHINIFLLYISKFNKDATDFKFLEPRHIIAFIEYLKYENIEYKTKNQKILGQVRCMINHLQQKYPEHVSSIDIDFILKNSNRIFKGKEIECSKVKYIQEDVTIQFDEKIRNIDSKSDLVIARIMRATGLRCNEVFRLKYDTVIVKDLDKFYLVLEQVSKTRVLDKYLPIDEGLAKLIQELSEEVSYISNNENNKGRYLFIYTQGRHKYKRISRDSFFKRLNRWSKNNNIIDENGDIYKFSAHMFRHTIASEFINSKMQLENIKQFLSHKVEDMTLEYASINMSTIISDYNLVCNSIYDLDENIENNISIVDDIIEVSNNMIVSKKKLGYCIKPKLLKCNISDSKCNNCKNYEDSIGNNI